MAAKMCAREGCENAPKSKRAKFCADVECERARARLRQRESKRRAREDQAAELGGDQLRPAGGVYAATLHALTEAGRMHTPAGQQALALAHRLDHGAADTGSSLASLGKQHLAALEEALKNLAVADDPVDELKARRRARSSA